MVGLTETQKQDLEKLRVAKLKDKKRVLKRQLGLLFVLAGVSVPYYAMAYDVGPCADQALDCPTVWVAFY